MSDLCSFNSTGKFKALMSAYRVFDGSTPTHLNTLMKTYVALRPLCSSKKHCLAWPAPCNPDYSMLAEQPSGCYHNNRYPLHLQEILEDSSSENISFQKMYEYLECTYIAPHNLSLSCTFIACKFKVSSMHSHIVFNCAVV